MKKTLIAAAVLSCFGSAAMAQASNVTIYGVVDTSIVVRDNDTDKQYTMESGNNAASRLGFRGSEDLGGGLKASFALEHGFDSDNGALGNPEKFFSRWSWIGLDGGFGSIRAGRQDSPMRTALNAIDPFANAGLAGAIDYFGFTGAADPADPTDPTLDSLGAGITTMERVDNQLTYILPGGLGGLNGSFAYVFGEQETSSKPESAWAFNLGWAGGGLAAQVAFSRVYGGAGSVDNLILGATYDFGFLKLHGGYTQVDSSDGFTAPEIDTKAFLLGVTVPIGDAMKFRGTYIQNQNDAIGDADSNAIAASLTYALSKRTQFYATLVMTDNDTNGILQVGGNYGPPDGEFQTGGKKTNAFAVGVQHNF